MFEQTFSNFAVDLQETHYFDEGRLLKLILTIHVIK